MRTAGDGRVVHKENVNRAMPMLGSPPVITRTRDTMEITHGIGIIRPSDCDELVLVIAHS
jgi:hypothetical protein